MDLILRLLGISLSGFEENHPIEQLSLFDIDNIAEGYLIKDNKHQKIDEVMDKIRDKHGIDKISRASLIRK